VTADPDHEAEAEEEVEGVQEEEGEGRPLSRADEEAAAAAVAAFDPEVHRQYLELPPWPNADESVLTVSPAQAAGAARPPAGAVCMWSILMGRPARWVVCPQLPTLPSRAPPRAQGSWDFDEHVYDYAARLPMTQTLSWENPRLVGGRVRRRQQHACPCTPSPARLPCSAARWARDSACSWSLAAGWHQPTISTSTYIPANQCAPNFALVWQLQHHPSLTLCAPPPQQVLFPSFLSPAEVRHMIRVSKDNLERSEVLVAEGEDTQSDIRTSSGFWPDPDEVIDAITERLHRALGIPQAFGEGLYGGWPGAGGGGGGAPGRRGGESGTYGQSVGGRGCKAPLSRALPLPHPSTLPS
jgi:hypothetical protein